MRILFVHDFGRLIGGTEVLIQREVRGLQARGHEVRTVVGCELGRSVDFGDYTFRTPGRPLATVAMFYNPAARRSVRQAVLDFDPDVVHFHTLSKASPSVLREVKSRVRVASLHDYEVFNPLLQDHVASRHYFERVRTVMMRRELLRSGRGFVSAASRHYFERVRTAVMRRGLLKLGAVVVPSEYVADVARSLGHKNVVVVSGCTPDAPQSPVVKKREVAYVGRLEPEKGVLELIREFALVSAAVPDVRLVIAGTGSLDGAVRDAALTLGDRVSVVGHVTPEEAQQIMACAAVSVVPSLWPEPFGLVGPESMACGTPVVASGRGGMSEWLDDGQNGLRADPTEQGAIAAALLRLLTDEDFRYRCVAGAIRTAAAFDIPSHTAKLEELYMRLLGWGTAG